MLRQISFVAALAFLGTTGCALGTEKEEEEETVVIPGATNINICGNGFVGHFQTMYDREIYLMMHGALVKEIP